MTLQLIPQVSGMVPWLTAVAARDRFVPHDIPVKGNATVRAVMSCLALLFYILVLGTVSWGPVEHVDQIGLAFISSALEQLSILLF